MGFWCMYHFITHPHTPWPPLLVFCLPSGIFSLRVHVTYTEDGEYPHTVWSPHSTVNTNQHQRQGEATWGQPQAVTPRAEKSTGQMVFDCKRRPPTSPTNRPKQGHFTGWNPATADAHMDTKQNQLSAGLGGWAQPFPAGRESSARVLTVHSPPLPHAG